MIDWNKFAQRVPPGTMVRNTESDHEWYAFLLESYPFRHDDLLAGSLVDEKSYALLMQGFDEHLRLRIQDLTLPELEIICPDWPFLEYFIDDEWLTFHEVMT